MWTALFSPQFPSGGSRLESETEQEEGPAEASPTETVPRKRPWGRITAVLVVAMVTITAVALSVRQPNRAPTIGPVTADAQTVVLQLRPPSQTPVASVNFTAQAMDPDGDALTYTWNFGDGSGSSGDSVEHRYTVPGRYIALLTVTDGKGGIATNDGRLIFVRVLARDADGEPPSQPSAASCPVRCVVGGLAVLAANTSTASVGSVARFTANASWAYLWTWNNATNPSAGGRLTIVSASEDASLFSFNYSWGDGSTNTKGPPSQVGETTHAFSSSGNSFVSLTSTAGGVNRFAGYTIRVVTGVASGQPRDSSVFASATAREPDSLDPAVDNESAGGEVLQNVYDTLLSYPLKSEGVAPLAPRLATVIPSTSNGGISPDGLNYTFHLLSNVTFHYNRAKITAQAVAFTFHRLIAIHDLNSPSEILSKILTNGISGYPGADCNPTLAGVQNCTIGDWANRTFPTRSAVPTYILAALPPEPVWDTTQLNDSVARAVGDSTVEPTDNVTVVFHLLRSDASFLPILASPVASVVSDVCLAANGGVHWGSRNPFLDHPGPSGGDCGSGPFMLSSWYRNQVLNLTRFDSYWQGRAKLREVDILPTRDVLAREFMLLAGDVDSAAIDRDHQWDVMNPDGTPISPSLRIVKDRPAFTMAFLGFNQRLNATAVPDPISIPSTFFNDTHIRRAFAFSFDYSGFIQNVTHDNGIQPRGPIPQGLFGYNASIPLVPFDLTQAAAELQNTTYWAAGFNLTLYYRNGNPYEQAGVLLLAGGLEALHSLKGSPGAIVVQVQALDPVKYDSALRAGGLPLALLVWTPRFADPSDSVVPFLRTGSPYPTWIGYGNATLDGLIDAAAGQLNDTRRVEEYSDLFAHAVLDDVPYLWVFQATSFHVERAWVRGYYFNPMLLGLEYYPMWKA